MLSIPLLLASSLLVASVPAQVDGDRSIERLVVQAPGGRVFFRDPHAGGAASTVRIQEVSWGRLVDVHSQGAEGVPSAQPVLRQLVIHENVQSDGVDYRLETHPVTQETKLVILREVGNAFFALARQASENLPVLSNKGPASPAPFGVLPRNAALVVQFDDLLNDDAAARAALPQTLRLTTGGALAIPFGARLRFDPNHGGMASGSFHSTRVLVDLAVSELEASRMSQPVPVNMLGLPEGPESAVSPNVLLSIPTQTAPTVGQFSVLTNLAGNPLSTTGNGAVNGALPTQDVLRALRSGNDSDLNNGFLLDLEAPQVLGHWSVSVEAAVVRRMRVHADIRFDTACQAAPVKGDILQVAGEMLEVVRGGTGPSGSGLVTGVLLRWLNPGPAANLLGPGLWIRPFDALVAVDPACWITLTPTPGAIPSSALSTSSQATVHFSEPIAPRTVDAADTLRFVRADSSVAPSSTNIVVADAVASSNLSSWTVVPQLPLAHTAGTAELYHFGLDRSGSPCLSLEDLSGNRLMDRPALIDLQLEPSQPSESNGSVVLRFGGPDELEPIGLQDLRGQFFYNLTCETIRPRPVQRFSLPVDQTQPVPSQMFALPFGIQAPLSPLGSKLHAVWRYADLGLRVDDETYFNLDVEGLSWAPQGGTVISDFFPGFEMRLSHADKLPDEGINAFLLPAYPNSGVNGSPNPFTSNILVDPESPQKVVHPRAAGYQISPANLFVSQNGTNLMPFPLNQGSAPYSSYTWRDTAILAEGGDGGAGVPMAVESGPPLNLYPPSEVGSVAGAGEVPSFGLPLLMEFRCYPSSTSIGLNQFATAIAINSSARPNFRAFSTGGVNTSGFAVTKDPDLEAVPSGGFNPSSVPPGQPTQRDADNTVYLGQMDVVVKISRAYSAWIDTQVAAPDYLTPVIEAELPPGTQITVDFRGATGFGSASTAPFDATQLDPYGDVNGVSVNYLSGTPVWSSDISDADGARYLQVRFSFCNNVATGLRPLLRTLGLSFTQ